MQESVVGRPQLDLIARMFSKPDRRREVNRVRSAQWVLANEPGHSAQCGGVEGDLIVRGPVGFERHGSPTIHGLGNSPLTSLASQRGMDLSVRQTGGEDALAPGEAFAEAFRSRFLRNNA